MRLLIFLTYLSLTPAVVAQVGVTQNGVPVTLQPQVGAYVAQLTPGAFLLTFPTPPDVVAVTFGPEGLFDLLTLPPATGLFGPGTAYAREEGPSAEHFMTDPLCADPSLGPGFNLLDPVHRTAVGYPVAAPHTDSTSRDCVAQGRLPVDTDLLRLLSPIHAVIRTEAGDTRLIQSFVAS